uniref:Alpha 1,4-glycosyltransferase domain-containing protein n=1 Tax=Ditylum brightwellii TaxID=49249 RepID=A0A6U3QJU3_9STRA|mmetsp:Transcript_34481/g.46182  ORF Transcript_34481/g.46182 Transcript_34481/m.46182 type:complete len:306 (+) Transcript_34481:50-967(+)
MQTPRPSAARLSTISTLTIVVLFAISTTFDVTLYNREQSVLRRTSVKYLPAFADEDEERPVIYTFHGINKDWADNLIYQHTQIDMLATWKKLWYDAGWDPVVLTDDDAKAHPDFDKYEKEISKLKIGFYDHLCFHRWMAMSQNGGGFMADIDSYPLNMDPKEFGTIPNSGKFTVFEGSFSDGKMISAVPSLLSGSAGEWESMFKGMMKYVPKHAGKFFSDMRALQEYVIDNPDKYIMDNKVSINIKKTDDGQIDCEKLKGKLTFHLSHRSMKEAFKRGHFEEDESKTRGFYAKQYTQDFLEQCAE